MKLKTALAMVLKVSPQWVRVGDLARATNCSTQHLNNTLKKGVPGTSHQRHTVEWRGQNLPAWYAVCTDPQALADYLEGLP